MLSMLQNIRIFVDTKLGDVVKWTNCEAGQSDANRGSARIPIDGMVFTVSCTGSYTDPPLGIVRMRDDSGKVIEGQKRDVLWAEIASYIRGRVAEKRGTAKPPDPQMAVILPDTKGSVKVSAPPATDGRHPHLGQGVKFILGRGEVISGMTELAALVTRVNSPTSVNLTIFPDGGEPFWRNDVPRFGRQADGSILEHGCWDFASPPVMELSGGGEYERILKRLDDVGAFTVSVTDPGHTMGLGIAPAASEVDTLRAEAERRGIEIDRRWGAEKLRKALADAA